MNKQRVRRSVPVYRHASLRVFVHGHILGPQLKHAKGACFFHAHDSKDGAFARADRVLMDPVSGVCGLLLKQNQWDDAGLSRWRVVTGDGVVLFAPACFGWYRGFGVTV